MAVIIGSARIDERGKLSGGQAGDQKQKSSINDTVGEVSMQNFYVHSKGWYILRPKDANIAKKMASNMKTACNNKNIGYDQGNRLGIMTYGVNSKVKTETDCSALVRACVKEASGKDPGNFSTLNEADMLEKSGLFEKRIAYTSGITLYTGDVLVTKTKGHTVIVVEGADRTAKKPTPNKNASTYYPKCASKCTTISSALDSIKVDSSKEHRTKIAKANGIDGYVGSVEQNTRLLSLLKKGTLKKA